MATFSKEIDSVDYTHHTLRYTFQQVEKGLDTGIE